MAVSCLDEPDCFRQNVNLIGISFKKMFDGRGDTVAIARITTSISDSVFVDHRLVSHLSLPLNYLKNETDFTIEGIDRLYHLLLTHQSKAQFVSEDCGQRFIVSNLGISHQDFDSIRLVSNSLSNPAHVNIEVYRCPRNNVMRFSFRQLFMDTVRFGKLDSRNITSIDNGTTPLYADTILSSVLLPLDPNSSTATFNFVLDDGDARTISVSYWSEEKIIFDQCGPQKLISKLDTTDNNFSILRIAKDSIYDPPYTNIEAYRCPTTNTIKMLFRQLRGSSKVTDTLLSGTITADFIAEPIYSDTSITNAILPLNPNASATTYSITDASGTTNTIRLVYTATPTTFHAVCGAQTVFTAIGIESSNFTTLPTVTDPKAKFPVVNNIEIIR
jgi:hypothetical protein